MDTLQSSRRRSLGIWKRVPWSLWVYGVISLLAIGSIEISASAPSLAKGLFAVIMVAWLCLLFAGVCWIWLVTVVIYALSIVLGLGTGSLTSLGTGLGVIGLTLLLLPMTRRYFAERAR